MEFKILSALSSNSGCMSYTDIVNLFPEDPCGYDLILKSMLDKGVIAGETAAYKQIRITPSGQALLFQMRKEEYAKRKEEELSAKLREEERQQHAKERAEDMKERKKERRSQFLASALGAFLGALFATLFELLIR